MSDRVSATVRSKIMAAVKTKNTGPEVAVRSMLHRLGYRYRLHDKRLAGSPDLVFPGRRKVVFVHGCFWHGHTCRWGRLPKTRPEYWAPKIEGNRVRDRRNMKALREEGWRSLTVWQCELKRPEQLLKKMCVFLDRP
jgi:DNA mismatch endonuclease (patch repair protein)